MSYIVYRHSDVTRVLRDGETFSSAVIGMRDVWGRKIIVGMDAPEHKRHRALVSLAFRQRTLARWEQSLIGRVVNDLIDIPAGAIVTSMLASANRDPDAYDNPESFDIFRDSKQHMSFGTGPHLCLGMHLARLETQVALNALFDRLPNLRLDHDQAQRLSSRIHGDGLFRNPTSLPVLWDQP